MIEYISWLLNMLYAEPSSLYEATLDADSTIASPDSVNSAVTVTTRWNDIRGPLSQTAMPLRRPGESAAPADCVRVLSRAVPVFFPDTARLTCPRADA